MSEDPKFKEMTIFAKDDGQYVYIEFEGNIVRLPIDQIEKVLLSITKCAEHVREFGWGITRRVAEAVSDRE